MSVACDVPSLPITSFEFRFDLDAEPRLPAYAGSAWRGAFGHALKKAVCVSRGTECRDCLLYRGCAYPYLFETPPPLDATKMRRYSAIPHPYALRVEPGQNGRAYRLGLTLFGRADRHAPYVIHAIERAGHSGLGRDRQPFRLAEVMQAVGPDLRSWRGIYAAGQPLEMQSAVIPDLPDLPKRVEISIDTPLRLRRIDHLVTPATFRFSDLFGALLRRISMLTHFHTDTPLEVDFARLTRASEQIAVEAPRLRWQDWTRYSSRQDTTMEMGGIVGRLVLRGDDLAPFWPYLWLGQWTLAGKATTMGLGRYRITAESLPPAPANATTPIDDRCPADCNSAQRS